MGLWEFYGERYDPGGQGGLEPERPPLIRSWIISMIGLILATAVLGGWGYLLWHWFGRERIDLFAITLFATFLYLGFAYFIVPRPDLENIGWLGGLFDHPWRYSDDVNRFLMLLGVLLLPGRILSAALVNPFLLDAVEAKEEEQERDVVDLTLRVRGSPHAEREVYDIREPPEGEITDSTEPDGRMG